MRRVALFSDVHGNLAALDAVLADIARVGVQETYCLGDLVGYGPDPDRVIDRVRTLGIPTIRGNYDRGVGGLLGDCGCYYATEEAEADGQASYEFTTGALGSYDRAWLYNLRDEVRIDHAGARIMFTHGSPRRINEYLLPDRSEEQLLRLADDAEADVVCHGHIHLGYHRRIETDHGPVHYLSCGSVGKPKDGDPRAGWLELVLGTEDEVASGALGDPMRGRVAMSEVWLGALIRRVVYDVESVTARMIAKGLPLRLAEALAQS